MATKAAIERPKPRLSNVVGMDEKANRVEVLIANITDEKIANFKSTVSDSSAIKFNEYDEIELDAAPPGSQLIFWDGVSSTARGGSLGFWVERTSNGEDGFVSAGHNYYSGQTSVYLDNVTGTDPLIGTVTDTGLFTHDTCYIRSNGNQSPTRNVSISGSTKTIYGYASAYPVGSPVGKIGRRDFHSAGTITNPSVSISIPVDGTVYNFSGLVRASYSASGGDSGGVVFYPDPGTYPNRIYIAGIHNAHDVYGAYFTTYQNITSSLDVVLW